MRSLIVFNHPYEGSFCNAILTEAIKSLHNSKQETDVINLDKDKFNPVMSAEELKAFVIARKEPDKAITMLEKRVIEYKNMLEKAEHLIFIFPIWWMLMPALTKGFIDKVIFPSIAYSYDEQGDMKGILPKLKKVTLITTMAADSGSYEKNIGNAVWKAFKNGTFETIGVKDCKWINFDCINVISNEERKKRLLYIKEYFFNK